MVRTKSITPIENEITKIHAELTKVKKRQNALAVKLLALQQEKCDCEAKWIIDGYNLSGKTLHEMIVFLRA